MSLSPLAIVIFWWMVCLAPGKDHRHLASVTARVLEEAEPLYRGDDERLRTAALVTAVMYRESAFDEKAVGDSGHSFCPMQLHDSSGGSRLLLDDTEGCVRLGVAMLRQSIRVDRANPVAFYARGPRFTSPEAQRISRDRVALARALLADRDK